MNNRPQPESVADFKARLSAMLRHTETPESKRADRPIVRPKGVSGFYSAPPMNDDPTQPTETPR